MQKEEVILKFTDLVRLLDVSNDDFDKFLISNKITSGRDFRRSLRQIRNTAEETIKLSLALEKQIREERKEKKDAR